MEYDIHMDGAIRKGAVFAEWAKSSLENQGATLKLASFELMASHVNNIVFVVNIPMWDNVNNLITTRWRTLHGMSRFDRHILLVHRSLIKVNDPARALTSAWGRMPGS